METTQRGYAYFKLALDVRAQMPNGGSDCCGTCWHNRSLGGKRGSSNFNRDIPSYCEIRELDIKNPFYTYCANHPYHRPQHDTIPIGPVYVEMNRSIWKESPDTEEIRQHLLDIVRNPEEHVDEGYHFFSASARDRAILQLLEWRDRRLISALEELSQRLETATVSTELSETIRLVRLQLSEGSNE